MLPVSRTSWPPFGPWLRAPQAPYGLPSSDRRVEWEGPGPSCTNNHLANYGTQGYKLVPLAYLAALPW